MKMRRRSARNADAAIKNKGTRTGSKQSEIYECNWSESRKPTMTCSEVCPSSDDLFEHVSQEHVSRGPKGFFCKWSECVTRRSVVFITLESLQRHLKSHIYGVADQANTSDDLDDELVDGEQENESDAAIDEEGEEEEEEEDEEDDDDEEDEEEIDDQATSASKKRKANVTAKGKAKIQKVDTGAAKKNNTASADKSKPSAASFDPSGFFYRYSCEWNVDASLYGMDTSISRYVKCKRKFKKYPEALDHLRNHHVEKLSQQEDPSFKCSWENCDFEECADADELKEHVAVHAKGE